MTRKKVIKGIILAIGILTTLVALTRPTVLVNANLIVSPRLNICKSIDLDRSDAGELIDNCSENKATNPNTTSFLDNVCAIFGNCPDLLTDAEEGSNRSIANVISVITSIANLIILLITAVSVFLVIRAGWTVLTAEQSYEAKEGYEQLRNAALGIAIAMLSFLIVRIIITIFAQIL